MDNNINLDNEIDVNFDAQFQTARQVLLKYTNAIQALRILAEEKYHVRPYHFDNYLLFKYFQSSNGGDKNSLLHDAVTTQLPPEPLLTSLLKIELLKHIQNRRRQIVYWISYFLVASILFFVYQGGFFQERNLVYPSIRIWRRLTLPVIQRFPRLTELYDESCLMENPFFQAEELDCKPCAYLDSVLELGADGKVNTALEDSGEDGKNDNSATAEFVPYVFKINQSDIHFQDFFAIYIKNQEIFRRDAYRVQSTNRYITNLEELFYQFNSSNDGHSKTQMHSLWRSNRMMPARLFRPLFARLPFKTGIAMERYISFDTKHGPTFIIPDTKCDNVYVQQLLGARFIILRPTSECRTICRTLSIRLPQSFVLSYNWLYWKPISAPDPVAETSSISLIGSYC